MFLGVSSEGSRGLLGAVLRLLSSLLGLLGGFLGASWGLLGPCWGFLGPLGGEGSKCPFVFPLCGLSGGRLGALLGRLGGFLCRLGGLLGRLEAFLGRLGALLGRLGALLGRLGALVGDAGAPKRAAKRRWSGEWRSGSTTSRKWSTVRSGDSKRSLGMEFGEHEKQEVADGWLWTF